MLNFLSNQYNFYLLGISTVTIFIFGLFVGKTLSTDSYSEGNRRSFPPLSDLEKIPDQTSLSNEFSFFSNRPFSCNAQLAFEELSQLHERRLKLAAHAARGDANRARTATIERKAGTAMSAENSFRSCVSNMMPELLNFWEEKNKEGLLKNHWDEKKEIENDGITVEELQQTAAELE